MPYGRGISPDRRAENYPQFLPCCIRTTIAERSDDWVAARIDFKYLQVPFSFHTRNPKRRPEWLQVRLVQGPFRKFEGDWHLTPLGAQGCRIDFDLSYEIAEGLLDKIAGRAAEMVARSMMDAFVKRAEETLTPIWALPQVAEESLRLGFRPISSDATPAPGEATPQRRSRCPGFGAGSAVADAPESGLRRGRRDARATPTVVEPAPVWASPHVAMCNRRATRGRAAGAADEAIAPDPESTRGARPRVERRVTPAQTRCGRDDALEHYSAGRSSPREGQTDNRLVSSSRASWPWSSSSARPKRR